ATSNLDLESKKAAPAKLPWQQPVNVFMTAGRPPGMEQLHQEAQLNLQSLLQGSRERGWGGLGWEASPHLCPKRVPLVADVPLPLQPPSRRVAEEESTSGTALGAQPPDTSLSLPTSPDKQTPWPRGFPLPPVEEKQWHQSDSIQTNIVPINVS
ncbi:NHSL1 protein, partial [Pitta sordida]|nr:NHSL1 protein [Pitta sordida]